MPRTLTVVGRLSASRRVRYGRFDCIYKEKNRPLKRLGRLAPARQLHCAASAQEIGGENFVVSSQTVK